MSQRGFDPKCMELADHFLTDAFNPSRARNSEERSIADDLAQAIQDAVEDFMRERLP